MKDANQYIKVHPRSITKGLNTKPVTLEKKKETVSQSNCQPSQQTITPNYLEEEQATNNVLEDQSKLTVSEHVNDTDTAAGQSESAPNSEQPVRQARIDELPKPVLC